MFLPELWQPYWVLSSKLQVEDVVTLQDRRNLGLMIVDWLSSPEPTTQALT